jgi:hypothetical protein
MIQRFLTWRFLRRHKAMCIQTLASELSRHGHIKRKQAWEAKRNEKTEQLRQEIARMRAGV